MTFLTNPRVDAVQAPPIPEAWSWIEGLEFPADRPLLDVCQAVPSSPPPEALRAHVAQRAADPATAKYTDIFGLPALRDGLAADIRKIYGGDVVADNAMITAGCNQAFFNTMVGLAAEGDHVILPSPWYFNHEMTADMLGIGIFPMPFRPERGGVPDPDDARRLVNDKTRAIVLVTPNNPSGAVYPPDVLDASSRWRAKPDVPSYSTRPIATFSLRVPAPTTFSHAVTGATRWYISTASRRSIA